MDTLIKIPEEFEKTDNYLKNDFEMKYLEKIKFCLDLQIERRSSGILVHKSNYIVNGLKHFNMDKAQFVAQGFLKKPRINYEHYVPPIMDPIYKFQISDN